tara:strand:- start:462 stop:758 length:297 start_codon:yes stop_codon:yes gene_type:complete
MNIQGDTMGQLSRSLMTASQGGMMAKQALPSLLKTVATGLGVVDEFDQAVPILGGITDAITIAAGAGSLIASAFDNPSDTASSVVKSVAPVVAQQIGA